MAIAIFGSHRPTRSAMWHQPAVRGGSRQRDTALPLPLAAAATSCRDHKQSCGVCGSQLPLLTRTRDLHRRYHNMAPDRTFLDATLLSSKDDELRQQLAISRKLIEESRRLLARAPASNPLAVRADQTSPEDKRKC
jgi:hypothetical protein